MTPGNGEQTGVIAAHDDIRSLASLARAVVDAVPEQPVAGSQRTPKPETSARYLAAAG